MLTREGCGTAHHALLSVVSGNCGPNSGLGRVNVPNPFCLSTLGSVKAGFATETGDRCCIV